MGPQPLFEKNSVGGAFNIIRRSAYLIRLFRRPVFRVLN